MLEEQRAFNEEMESIFGTPLAPAAMDRGNTTHIGPAGGIEHHGRVWEEAEEVFDEEWSALEGRGNDSAASSQQRIPKNAALMLKLERAATEHGTPEEEEAMVAQILAATKQAKQFTKEHSVTAGPPPNNTSRVEGGELQSAYLKLTNTKEAVSLMEEWEVTSAEDLRFLAEEDASRLAKMLKKIPGAKLMRALGY